MEAHCNGNLPRLQQYLSGLDAALDASNPDPPPEGSPPGSSPSLGYGVDSMGRR